MARLSDEKIIDSPAYKMLESMIQDKVDELLSLQRSLDFRIKQAKKPSYREQVYPKKDNGRIDYNAKPEWKDVYYTPTLATGTSFEADEQGERREVKLKFETSSLKDVLYIINNIINCEEQIQYLNREKLYLLAPDGDWQDGERRYKRVFGKATK